MATEQTYELFARSLMQSYASRLDLPYEAAAQDYRELTERAERARLMEKWNATTPDGRTVGEKLMAEAREAGQRRLTDAYGNRFFEVGDLVTRDGTDVHRVVEHNGSQGYAPDGFTVVCVKAPSGGWTEVGEEEFNTCSRYEWVDDAIEGEVLK